MKTLDRYILKSFATVFGLALVVSTFVMALASLVKMSDMLARGVPWRPLVLAFLCTMPQAFSFTIPLSGLVSALLVFERLSRDGELTAMVTAGLPMVRLAAPPLLFAGALSALCLFLLGFAVPEGHYRARVALARLMRTAPLELLEVGQFSRKFPDLDIYVGDRRGNTLRDVRIYDSRTQPVREIRAKTGTVRTDAGELTLQLHKVRVDPAIDGNPDAGFCRELSVPITTGIGGGMYRGRVTDLTLPELYERLNDPSTALPGASPAERRREVSKWRVEFHERLALSGACVAFVLLGLPLGIRTRHLQTSLGTALSLGLMVLFYLFVIVADSLAAHPEYLPQVIVWIPVVADCGLGLWLLNRVG